MPPEVQAWSWRTAPEWVRELAPLNGDDVSIVTLHPPRHDIHLPQLSKLYHGDRVMVWCAKGILMYEFHA